jgi:regulator of sigma E protease
MAVVVWQVGRPESEFDSTTIGFVEKDGPADKAGLKVGDVITSVDGKPVKHFSGTDGVQWAIIRSEGEKIRFVVEREGKELTIDSGWKKEETSSWRRPAFRKVMISPRYIPSVGFVTRKSPAEVAGVKANDVVVEANGKPIFSLLDLEPIVVEFSGKNLPLVVEREIENQKQRVALTIAVPATKNDKEGINLGVDWGKIILTNPGPLSQVTDAAMGVFRTIGAVVSPHSDVSVRHLSSPVGILRLYYQVFDAPEGWRRALALSVLINVNLAMLNMLPFPVLDGGHITLALLEAIRRKPVNPRVMETIQTACAILLIGFMAFVAFFDIGDLIGGDSKKPIDKTPAAQTPQPAQEKAQQKR